jgi:hypothetical protein
MFRHALALILLVGATISRSPQCLAEDPGSLCRKVERPKNTFL